mmetsp:Transcript_78663/g.138966  ORF Transcript_78663/g.138966 Transcript_78663/m.138966 type:complete len:243 (-) Transcript_78663:17-745(-)
MCRSVWVARPVSMCRMTIMPLSMLTTTPACVITSWWNGAPMGRIAISSRTGIARTATAAWHWLAFRGSSLRLLNPTAIQLQLSLVSMRTSEAQKLEPPRWYTSPFVSTPAAVCSSKFRTVLPPTDTNFLWSSWWTIRSVWTSGWDKCTHLLRESISLVFHRVILSSRPLMLTSQLPCSVSMCRSSVCGVVDESRVSSKSSVTIVRSVEEMNRRSHRPLASASSKMHPIDSEWGWVDRRICGA